MIINRYLKLVKLLYEKSLNNKMLSYLVIHAGFEGGDIVEKYITRVNLCYCYGIFFLDLQWSPPS